MGESILRNRRNSVSKEKKREEKKRIFIFFFSFLSSPNQKGIRLIFLNLDKDIFVVTQLNLETLAKVLGRVLFSC